ncbi:hypothetical protein FH972_002727 [Carpinus fangiana]|uniref:Uncharacterized protein n=1 Tax=Carpinus fangiana TaxID=176857 RepID=A0A5N6QID0_9ROSI|nr:hypothetical protein FH972_002727 [Carpinus fangiana]
MEANHGSVVVMLGYGALKCAGEALATLLLSALVKAQLFAPYALGFFTTCLLSRLKYAGWVSNSLPDDAGEVVVTGRYALVGGC